MGKKGTFMNVKESWIAVILSIIICTSGIIYNNGKQAEQLNNYKDKLTYLENTVNKSLDQKLSLERFTEFNKNLDVRFGNLDQRFESFSKSNDITHKELKDTMKDVNTKIDILIDRKNK